MKGIIVIIIIAIVAYYFYRRDEKVKECQEPEPSDSQPMQFDLLDENGDPIKRVTSNSPAGKVKVVIGGGDSDAPIQELQYFCIKDKGYQPSCRLCTQRNDHRSSQQHDTPVFLLLLHRKKQ